METTTDHAAKKAHVQSSAWWLGGQKVVLPSVPLAFSVEQHNQVEDRLGDLRNGGAELGYT